MKAMLIIMVVWNGHFVEPNTHRIVTIAMDDLAYCMAQKDDIQKSVEIGMGTSYKVTTACHEVMR